MDLAVNMGLSHYSLSNFPTYGVLGDFFTAADISSAVLMSRTAQEGVVDRFELQKVYRLKSREQVLAELKGHYKVKVAPDGTISVTVEDRDPARAAAMAMAFLEMLDRYKVTTRKSRAQRTRQFLEQRVQETDSLLSVSENTLRNYQESHYTVVPLSDSGGKFQSGADLMARKIQLEVRLGVLQSYLGPSSDEVIQTRTELEQLENRIRTLPELRAGLIRLVRDAAIQEQLYLMFTAELERARIRELMNAPTIQILEPAVAPDRHSRPKRVMIAVGAMLLTSLASVVYLALRRSPPIKTGSHVVLSLQ
jgi:tyrosine-protein kinase Etk/Wzc